MLGDAQAALKDAEAALEEDKEFNKVFVYFLQVHYFHCAYFQLLQPIQKHNIFTICTYNFYMQQCT